MSKGMLANCGQTAQILLVDDDPIITATLRDGLLEAGYNITVEHSAAQALNAYQKQTPDLAVVDIGLPDMAGTTLVAAMLEHRHRPILILSSHSDEPNIDAAIKSGVAGYLVKPLSVQQLIPSIETALARFFEISMGVTTRLGDAAPRDVTLNAVLDQFAFAVAIVDKNGKVLYENTNGRHLLDQHALLHRREGRLYAHAHQKTLTNSLTQVLCGSSGAQALTLDDGKLHLNLFMSPLDNTGTAIVLVIDRQKSSIAPAPILRTLYNLTAKESQLAENLLNGCTLEEYCAQRHVSLNTVRSQLKAIYRKTGTNRQSELIRLLSRLFDNFNAKTA